MKINFEPIFWQDMTVPLGKLPRERGAQALWYYYMLASKLIAKSKPGETLRYEGEDDIYHSLEAIYRSVCTMYTVDLDEVQNFWPAVDEQIDFLNTARHSLAWREGEPTSFHAMEKLADQFRAPLGDRATLLF